MKRNLNKNFKKILLIIAVLMIALNSIYSQTKPTNLLSYSKVDTNQVNDLYYIGLSLKKEIADNDSLKLELKKANEIIELQSALIGQNNQIKGDFREYIKTLDNNYNSLEKDYNRLKKSKKLRGLIGGGVNAFYSLDSRQFNDLNINLHIGLMFADKYITSIAAGIGINRNINIGLTQSIVF